MGRFSRARIGGVLILFAYLRAELPADVIRVPEDAPTCAEAIAMASDGDVILVAPGDHESAAPISFSGKRLTLRSEGGPEVTTLRMADPPTDPERASVIILESGEEEALVEGFTIRGGRGTTWGGGHSESGGGGILIRNGSTAAVKTCIITGNRGANGAGILVAEGSALELERSTISHNWGNGMGGGILFDGSSEATVLRGSTFLGNSSASGGGLFFLGASGTVSSCEVIGNYADSVAGGMCCLSGGSPRIERTIFMGNTAFGGGAISCETADDNPVLVNCLIAGNAAAVAGAFQFRDGSAAALIHCTVTRNFAIELEGGLSCRGGMPGIRSSIVQGNFPDSLCGELSFTLTDPPALFVRLGDYDFERTVEVVVDGLPRLLPDFVKEPGDYRLKPGSPAVDAADPLDGVDVDIAGWARPCGSGPDQGAYELCEGGGDPPFIRGDANANGLYDIADPVFTLHYLFGGGEAGPCARAGDTDDSATVEITDAVRSLNYLFLGGPAPSAPFPECGSDPGPGGLDCTGFPPCGP